MAIQKTEAFILKTHPFRTSSLIVTFFSQNFGKLKGVAKGVRREREVRGATFELFTHLEIVFYEKLHSDLHLVSDAAVIESYDHFRTRLETIAYASYFSELVDQVCEVHDPHPNIFELMKFTFKFLSSVPLEKLARIFEIKMLGEIGWLPYLDACLNCQETPLNSGYFSIKQGGLFCLRCGRSQSDARLLSEEGLQTLRYFAGHSAEMSLKKFVPAAIESELEKLISYFLLYRIGYPLNSRRFMEKIHLVLS